MPTRKELLEDLQFEIENLSGRVTEGSEALEKQGQNQIQAAEKISRGLSNLGGDIIAAVVVGGFFSLVGKATSTLINQLMEIKRKTDMINSIQKLQDRYSSLSYEFIVERSYVQGASKDERQNILNELLHDEIVTAKELENGEVLSIDPDNPNLIEYWERLDSLREILEKEQRKLSGK